MLCSKILVAYDNSEQSQKALEWGIALAKTDPEIEIQVVHVITLPVFESIDVDNFQALEDTIYQAGKEMIAQIKSALSQIPNKSQALLLDGKSPAYTLLNHAKENNCDLIVMGGRGLGGIKEFLGSASHTIVNRSKIPVLIVK